MGMIRIHEKAGKTKRKPGWQQREAEYAAWLNGVKTMASGIQSQPRGLRKPADKKVIVVTDVPVRKATFVKEQGTKVVSRPEITYKDDPDMLARELKARERKFCTAPAYNKGNAVLITDEMMKDITAGLTRRR